VTELLSFQNVAFTAALGCLARGCYLAHPAAGWIVPSVVVLFIVVKGYRPEVKTDA
jgi:hypothetical protein